jgi:hypothetical protein
VDIRVGKGNCGGYKGVVYWGGDLEAFVRVTGTLWDNCNYYTPNTTVYLYVKYDDLRGSGHQAQMAQVSGVTNTTSIDATTYDNWYYATGSASNIYHCMPAVEQRLGMRGIGALLTPTHLDPLTPGRLKRAGGQHSGSGTI